jgi:hypothetical protein
MSNKHEEPQRSEKRSRQFSAPDSERSIGSLGARVR